MSRLIGKVKGRGFFNGIKRTSTMRYRDTAQQEAYIKDNPLDHVNHKRRWYEYININPIFKRNLSDVYGKCIFDTLEEYNAHINGIVTNKEYIADGLDFSFIDKINPVEYIQNNREKRIIDSAKREFYSKSLLNLALTTNKKDVRCGGCGTNIYDDEYRINAPYTTLCIHCLAGLSKRIEVAYAKTPESYKDDWLLARSIEF